MQHLVLKKFGFTMTVMMHVCPESTELAFECCVWTKVRDLRAVLEMLLIVQFSFVEVHNWCHIRQSVSED